MNVSTFCNSQQINYICILLKLIFLKYKIWKILRVHILLQLFLVEYLLKIVKKTKIKTYFCNGRCSLCWTSGAGTGFLSKSYFTFPLILFNLVDYFCTLSIPFLYGTWILSSGNWLYQYRGSKWSGPTFSFRRILRVNTPLPPQLATFATLLVCLPSVSPATRTGESGRAQIRRQQKIDKLLPSVTLSSHCVAGLDLHMLARWGRTGVGVEPISSA